MYHRLSTVVEDRRRSMPTLRCLWSTLTVSPVKGTTGAPAGPLFVNFAHPVYPGSSDGDCGVPIVSSSLTRDGSGSQPAASNSPLLYSTSRHCLWLTRRVHFLLHSCIIDECDCV